MHKWKRNYYDRSYFMNNVAKIDFFEKHGIIGAYNLFLNYNII